MQIEKQCSKNYFSFFLPQEAGAFGNNMEKTTQKSRSKFFKKICILYIYREYLTCLQFNASDGFLQTCIDFVEQTFFETD